MFLCTLACTTVYIFLGKVVARNLSKNEYRNISIIYDFQNSLSSEADRNISQTDLTDRILSHMDRNISQTETADRNISQTESNISQTVLEHHATQPQHTLQSQNIISKDFLSVGHMNKSFMLQTGEESKDIQDRFMVQPVTSVLKPMKPINNVENDNMVADFKRILQNVQNSESEPIQKPKVVTERVPEVGPSPDEARVLHAIEQGSPCVKTFRPQDPSQPVKPWQWLKTQRGEYFLHSAFVDDRPGVGVIPVLRVLALTTRRDTLYCQLWYRGRPQPYVVAAESMAAGTESTEGYRHTLVSCLLPGASPLPTHVSLSPTKCYGTPVFIPVYAPVRSIWEYEFGICTFINQENINASRFIEWIVVNRLFGVSEINLYNSTISSAHDDLLTFLADKGYIRLHQAPPVTNNLKTISGIPYNDCMLRYMYKYRYILITNLYEVVVPKMHHSYGALLSYLNKRHQLWSYWPSYTLRNQYFFLDFEQNKQQPRDLVTLSNTQRTEAMPHLFACRSFVDPRQCLSVGEHFCWLRFPNTTTPWTIDVDAKVAANHHYKHCTFNSNKCKELFDTVQDDRTMLNFRKEIVTESYKITSVIH